MYLLLQCFLEPSDPSIKLSRNRTASDFIEIHRPIDARLEIHFAIAMRKSMPESNPMLRIIAPYCRVRLGGEVEGKRKEKKKNTRRFVIIVSFASSLRCIEPQRQTASSSCGASTGAHARPLGSHMRYFFLSQHPHTCIACT